MASSTRIEVAHADGDYVVVIGGGALTAQTLSPEVAGRRVFVITSAPVRALHGERLQGALNTAAQVHWLEAPDGEAAKTVDVAAGLWREILRLGGKRDSLVVGFGGGTIGDLAGFVAACFLRGVDFVQVPTTVLAQVDAAVGGKVGVDLPAAKNSVGAFHQPLMVVADTELLATLPKRHVAAGLAESVKMAAVLDADSFAAFEGLVDACLAVKPEALREVVARSVAMKAAVVAADPFERGERMLLNFGHTLGHAIETCLGFEQLEHGEAVAHGMRFAVRLSRRAGLPGADADRLLAAVDRLAPPPLPPLDTEALLQACGRDKKAREHGLSWVLCPAIGRGLVSSDLDQESVRRDLATVLAASA